MLVNDEVACRVVDAYNEANDIIGYVNSARLCSEDTIESDIDGGSKSYSVTSFLLALDDLLNDDGYEHFSEVFYEIIEKYAFKQIIVSLKRGF